MKRITPLLIIISILSGCEDFFITEIEPPQMAKEHQLVVHSYLSPNFGSVVFVSLSKPVFSNSTGKEFAIVENATVTLSDQNNHSVTLPYIEEHQKYFINADNFQVIENYEYKINVSEPGGMNVSSSCIIPKIPEGGINNIQFHIKQNQYYDDEFHVSFEFDDKQGTENYYKAFASVEFISAFTGEIIYHTLKWDLISDHNRDGETIALKSRNNHLPISEMKKIKISLQSIDETYYYYHKAIKTQWETDDMGPFSEPVIINSNMENGIGMFCGFSRWESKTKYY